MKRTIEEAAETYANLSHEDFDGNIDWHYQNAFIAGAKWQQQEVDTFKDAYIERNDACNELIQQNQKWSALEKIAPPEKWIKVYEHYQEILTQQDVSGWWQEQFLIADSERNELKKQIAALKALENSTNVRLYDRANALSK